MNVLFVQMVLSAGVTDRCVNHLDHYAFPQSLQGGENQGSLPLLTPPV